MNSVEMQKPNKNLWFFSFLQNLKVWKWVLSCSRKEKYYLHFIKLRRKRKPIEYTTILQPEKKPIKEQSEQIASTWGLHVLWNYWVGLELLIVFPADNCLFHGDIFQNTHTC